MNESVHELVSDVARKLLRDSVISFRGRPIGTLAAHDPRFAGAINYQECFVRDFVPAAMVFLADQAPEIVTNFLDALAGLSADGGSMAGHDLHPGVMPASFEVKTDDEGEERLVVDFGNRAIGRVAPVDSMMWWAILLWAHQCATGDEEFARRPANQTRLELMLDLCLKGSFEVFPTLLVPDGCCMIDRRMGIYGHPLEIQALFYGLLVATRSLLRPNDDNRSLLDRAQARERTLRAYVREHYWVDATRLNEIHRFRAEEFGAMSLNALNIHPDAIPRWVTEWLPDGAGYFVGNLGPERMDFRFFALGNLLAVLFGLATKAQTRALLDLYQQRWEDLVGSVPAAICFPAVEGEQWHCLTGSDPKNRPWSYHNGGHWPVLLWPLVAAALRADRRELAERACQQAWARCPDDRWPEYYDGRRGRLVGRFANLEQVWTAAGLLMARNLLDRPQLISWFPDGSTSLDCAHR
jgi:glycogen debranching enzyme